MELRRLRLLALSLGAAVLLVPAVAHADPVLLMHANGTVTRVQNRFITTPAALPGAPSATNPLTRGPGEVSALASAQRRPDATATTKTKAKTSAVTVNSVLLALYRSKQIALHTYHVDVNAWNAALAEEKHISASNAVQLTDVTELLHNIAASGKMTASRLPVLFLTLERNAQYWKSGPALSYSQRVQFSGSNLEWEFYPGQGIQLQVLGTFGEANGFYEAGPSEYGQLTSLLAEMIPLAVKRGGGIAWEYYFDFDGGTPPWVSGMAEATGIEALTNAYKATKDANYLTIAHEALGILDTAPPTGVAVHGPIGIRFLQYDFEPSTEIINADLQTLIGLDDYWETSNDPLAGHLFRSGNLQAAADVPAFNIGGWSLYQPGEQDDLSYHQLVTGFLQTLCQLTSAQGLASAPVYCDTGNDFQGDLTTPPTLNVVTTSAMANTSFHLVFTLDKPAHVGVVVTNTATGKTYLYTSADCEAGTDYWISPALPAGTYSVKLSATDLAGNYTSVNATLTAGSV